MLAGVSAKYEWVNVTGAHGMGSDNYGRSDGEGPCLMGHDGDHGADEARVNNRPSLEVPQVTVSAVHLVPPSGLLPATADEADPETGCRGSWEWATGTHP